MKDEKLVPCDKKNYDLDFLTEEYIPDKKIREIVTHHLTWYSKKASKLKMKYFCFKVLIIVLTGIIPIINQIPILSLEWKVFISTLLSSASAIAASLLVLFTIKDNWIEYRGAAELIKREVRIYAMKLYPYSDENTRDKIFIQNIENKVQSNHLKWKEITKNNENTNNNAS